jgi:transcriptional regulator with XRE-family HTH domain
MTQDDFSEYCKVSRISIARYEAGSKISRENAQKIASACHVSLAYVIGDENDEETKNAPSKGLDDSLVEMLTSLSPNQVQRVVDFVSGLKAADKG